MHTTLSINFLTYGNFFLQPVLLFLWSLPLYSGLKYSVSALPFIVLISLFLQILSWASSPLVPACLVPFKDLPLFLFSSFAQSALNCTWLTLCLCYCYIKVPTKKTGMVSILLAVITGEEVAKEIKLFIKVCSTCKYRKCMKNETLQGWKRQKVL